MIRAKLPVLNPVEFPKTNSRIDQTIMSRWSQDVKAADDDNNTITIYQPIGEDFFSDGFTARRMSAALRSIGERDVVVSINSPGGDFFEGATIYNLLREHKGKVTVKIPGLAASAASLIAMAGDRILVSEIGFLMIHNAWGIVIGNRNDMRKAAETFDVFDSAMADVYAARTGFDRSEIAKMMDSDTWLNASNAIEKGFADELMPAKSIEDAEGSKDKKAMAVARRKVEMALAQQGFSRKEREDIFKQAIGPRDAADAALRDAGYTDEDLKELINVMKT